VKKGIKKINIYAFVLLLGFVLVTLGSWVYSSTYQCDCADYYAVFNDCDNFCSGRGGCYMVENQGSFCMNYNCRMTFLFVCGNDSIRIKSYTTWCSPTCTP